MGYYQENNPKRQKLIRQKPQLESFVLGTAKKPVIDTIEKLEKHLQAALVVEHFTIPPYLCALYSIQDEKKDEDVLRIIRTVVIEEMLHMVMVANLMNALNMKPQMEGKSVIRSYPDYLPNGSRDFKVGLVKFSRESINTFLRIEKPAQEGAKPETDNFHSIGQFYEAIRESLIWLENQEKSRNKTLFIGDPQNQVPGKYYWGGGGKLLTVSNLKEAELVLDEIVGQGEGIDGSINAPFGESVAELAHYFRFNQLLWGKKYNPSDTTKNLQRGKL
jgi:hypothetical protein